ncbi:MAG TPA: DUF6596 domain-containing protein, partial [Bryobacteraceae bacterium]|nr:DUF6596 domain-containing protein [Bryobacteraceae bacterium]
MTTLDGHRAAEEAARTSYGRLVAFLVSRWRDLADVEDALGDAFRSALESWPRHGVPDKPEAWLLSAARRRLVDKARHHALARAQEVELTRITEDAMSRTSDDQAFPDERLNLLFACAHPAINEAIRTPLLLQVVLGLYAAAIASAFLVSPSTMGQRLVRAKTKIRDAGIRFARPEPEDLAERLEPVLEAIYAAYGSGWKDVAGSEAQRQGLSQEAIWLARLVVEGMPDEPEAKGLLALMLHSEARRPARYSDTGAYVPLSEQDVTRWSGPMFQEAEKLLALAAEQKRTGRFQLEAAIQSAHAHRVLNGEPGWEEIALLYEGLLEKAPTIGVFVSRAAAVAEARGPAEGLKLLDAIPAERVRLYQPYWALRAHLAEQLGRTA